MFIGDNNKRAHSPPRTCFAIWAYGRGGGVAIINDGDVISAARNTSRTSRRESIQIGTFPAGQ